MIIEEAQKRLAPQKCPLCGEYQDIIVNGHKDSEESKGHILIEKDRGYSFCNCRNIFFTDWQNIKQSRYDEDYSDKYNNETVKKIIKNYSRDYFSVILHFLSAGQTDIGAFEKRFLEIGAINPFLLDDAKKMGFKTYGLDIIKHDFKGHEMLEENFEDLKTLEKFDVIFASHIFEHFKDPLAAIQKCYDIMEPGGILFVAMPDPYFVDWKNPYQWAHWHIEEHHIMWDMRSFCSVVEERGFKLMFSKRNPGYEFICIGDYHLIFKKK